MRRQKETKQKTIKKKTKVKFEIIYTPALATKVFDLMSRCDLGIVGGEYPVKEVWSWSTTAKVDLPYVTRMHKAIRIALEVSDITQIHSIKLVKDK